MSRRALLVAAVCAAALAPCMPGLLSGGLSIPGDGGEIPLPALAAAGQALASGQLPAWTELVYTGAPLVSSGGAGILYPPNALLFALLPAGWAYTLSLGLHLLFAAWGSAALARRLGAGDAGQAVAALAFACGGFMVGHLENLLRVEAIAFAPWAFLAAEGLARRPGARAAALWALVIGVAALTGYYPFTVYLSGWALLYALIRGLQRRAPLTTAGWALAGTGWGVLISMAQTLPTAAATLRSARLAARDPTLPTDNSLHPTQLLELLAPFTTGADLWDAQMVLYAGLTPLALALLAWSPRARGALRRPEAALALIAAASLLLSLGEHLPGYDALTWLLPPLAELGRPYRLFIGGATALAALAGLGLSDERPRALAGTLTALAGLGAALALTRAGSDAPGGALVTAAGVAAALAGAGAALTGRRALAGLAGALLVGELLIFQARLTSDIGLPPQRLETPETAAWLMDRLEPGERFLSIRPADDEAPELLWMQAPMRFGLASVNSPVTDLIPRWFAEAYGHGRDAPVSTEVLGLLRVRYVLARGYWRGAEPLGEVGGLKLSELTPAPRAFAVDTARVMAREDMLRELGRLESPWEAALLEEEAPLDVAPDAEPGGCGPVSVTAATATSLTLHYRGERPCYVVITDAWDPDWRATIDGEAAPLLRAYGGLRAVAVPAVPAVSAGPRVITLSYRPLALWWGLGLSAVSLLGGLATARRSRRGDRASSAPE